MSYAGPVSRAKRASAAESNRPADPRNKGSQARLPVPPPAHRAASYTDDHRPTFIFAAGIIVGMAVGAGVALMFAPQPGAETRRALGRSSRRAAQRGHDAWDDLRDEISRAVRRRRRAFRARREAMNDPASLD
jgi:hypothetical protein